MKRYRYFQMAQWICCTLMVSILTRQQVMIWTHGFKTVRNAVVLLHDTHEIAPGFGVHTLWAELKEQNPQKCMEFPHSHGLGIYFPNSAEAAENLRNALGMDLSKAFHLFTVCGDFTYCEINGKSLMQKQTVFDLSQIAELLSQVKTQNPPVAHN